MLTHTLMTQADHNNDPSHYKQNANTFSHQITDIGASLSRDEMHLKPAAKSETMASVMSSIRT